MSGYRVQCVGCGYLTQLADIPCPQCGTQLSLGHIIGESESSATMYTGDLAPAPFGWGDQTEAMGSLPKNTAIAPEPAPLGDAELPAISVSNMPPMSDPEPGPELPAISMAGSWDSPPAPVGELVLPIGADPREFQPPPPVAQPEPAVQPWTMEAPSAPPVDPAPSAPPPHQYSMPAQPEPHRVAPPHHTAFAPPVPRVQPPRKKVSTGLLIGIAAAIVAAIGLGVLAAAVWSSNNRPGSETTRKKYATILASQPNFIANLEGIENGVPLKTRYASLNGERLIEVPLPRSMFLDTSASGTTQVAILFQQDDKVTAIAHEFWTYRTVTKASLGVLASSTDPFGEIGRMAAQKTVTITEAGSEKVGEYDTTLLLLSEVSKEPIQLNIAPALNNLIVRLDVPAGATKQNVPLRYTLSNVSMTVDPDLFRVPSSYNQLKAP